MSLSDEIGEPFTLASLPHFASQPERRVHASSVYNHTSTKKLKRTEVVIGLDGEGVSIYNIRNPRLVTSYAIPPQHSFLTKPHSICYKRTESSPPRRFTYALIKEDTSDAPLQLICFAEQTRSDAIADVVQTRYTSFSSSYDGAIISTYPYTTAGSSGHNSHEVVTIFANGDILCLSANLDIVRWSTNLKSRTRTHYEMLHVKFASIHPAVEISKGLLKSREDIIALFPTLQDEESKNRCDTQILCVIVRNSDDTQLLQLFQIPPPNSDLSTLRNEALNHLLTFTLQTGIADGPPGNDRNQYSLHAATGVLHVLSSSTIVTYNFSEIVPTITTMDIPPSNISSFLRTSNDRLLTVSESTCRILDTRYQCVLAEQVLTAPISNDTGSEAKKRKLLASYATASKLIMTAPLLIAFYGSLGLAVGVRNHEIIGIQIESMTMPKRAKKRGTRLIDAIGRGMPRHRGNVRRLDVKDEAQWRERVAKLSKYARKRDVAKFEKLMASDLGINLAESDNRHRRSTSPMNVNGHIEQGEPDGISLKEMDQDEDGQSSAEEHLQDEVLLNWEITLPTSKVSFKHHQYASFAMSRIFEWILSSSKDDALGRLKIVFFPPNVFQWLLQTGRLTKESVQRAILDNMEGVSGNIPRIQDGDIVQAVVDFDPELHILSAILNHGPFLPVGEVAQAIKLLLQGLDEQPQGDLPIRLLTNGTVEPSDEMEIDIASELEAASNEMNRALNLLVDGIAARSTTLRPALMRLHTFPPTAVSSSLRKILSRHDLESLIRLLHHEFKHGGWTSPYDFLGTEIPRTDSTEDANDSALTIIASLLSSTIDAIGPTVWLNSVDQTSTREISNDWIVDLLEDTSTALNGFWEATYIRGLIGEILRYATKNAQSLKPTENRLKEQGKPTHLDLTGEELPMLPLGSKPDPGISMRQTYMGKSRQRSAREIGMMISKKVPRYSLERIVI